MNAEEAQGEGEGEELAQRPIQGWTREWAYQQQGLNEGLRAVRPSPPHSCLKLPPPPPAPGLLFH